MESVTEQPINHRAKWVALAVCVALIVAFFWQRTRIEKLRTENGDLGAKLAAAQAVVTHEQSAPVMPASPDPELLRLRAEVAELRRQTTQLSRARGPLVKQTQNPETDERPFETRIRHNTLGMMRLVLAMRSVMSDGGGSYPIVNANGELTPELRRECERFLREDDATSAVDFNTVWPDVELVITDAADVRKLDGNTIIARTVPIKSPDGKWARVYVFADGSGHRRVHDTPDEVWQGAPE